MSVKSGTVRIFNSTLDALASGSVTVDGAKGVRLTGNKLGGVAVAGDSVTVQGSGEVYVDGNEFRSLPADLQLIKSDRPVTFRDNVVDDVDLGPFLFNVGPAVRVSGNRFECDCDPRRISVLKLNQVFPGLLSEADTRFADMLTENFCQKPEHMTLAGYRDQLIKEIACEGTNVTTAAPPARASSKDATINGGTAVMAALSYTTIVLSVSVLHVALVYV